MAIQPDKILRANQATRPGAHHDHAVIFVGASTGGPDALKQFLMAMPPLCPPILIAQHILQGYVRPFAERLNSICAITVAEGRDGERVARGHAYIAPDHAHMRICRRAGLYFIETEQSAPVSQHRPSVDVLFDSAALALGKHGVGVILTGMGGDGAAGLLKMKRAGARTFAQDEASCVVFGMPRRAIALGAVDEILPMQDIGKRVLQHLGISGFSTSIK